MDDPCCAKMFSITGGIGHIIFMGQKNGANPSHLLERIDQRPDVARRINQPVAVGMPNEITVAAERLLRIESGIINLPVQMKRKTFHRTLQPRLIALLRADRADRAGQERLIGLMQLGISLRLMNHGRVRSRLREGSRSKLSTGVAVDAGGINKEVAGDVRL